MAKSTPTKQLNRLYTAGLSRQIDRCVIDELGINSFELMQRAARSALDVLIEHWPDLGAGSGLQIFCGKGNNGGDGYLLATLANREGIPVKVVQMTPPEELTGDVERACSECTGAGIAVDRWCGSNSVDGDVLVDAMLGTGLGREVSGPYLDAIRSINRSARPVLAIDLPSGLSADMGSPLPEAVQADVTVTFIVAKQGLYSGIGKTCAGLVELKTLGVSDVSLPSLPTSDDSPDTVLISGESLCGLIQQRPRHAHKGHFGHLLVVGGNFGMPGAVILSAESALFSGSGKVSVATRSPHLLPLVARRPELMVCDTDHINTPALLMDNKDAVVIGPGLGDDDWARAWLIAALQSRCPLVVDADALNLVAGDPVLLIKRKAAVILTPHSGEAARLLSITAGDVERDRFSAVRALYQKYVKVWPNLCVVLKGTGTLIFDGTVISVCSAGNPGMAVAGMGDVLSGVVGALLGQGQPLARAAELGVWSHAAGADEIAKKQGEIGILAQELLPYIRTQLSKLSLNCAHG